MIEVTGLSKRYGTYLAVKDVSFSIEKGEFIGFLGPNGAGKSTIMNILTGYLSLTQGKVEIDGYDIAEYPEDAKRRIGYLPEIPPLYTDMKVREYLNFIYDLKKVKFPKKPHIDEILRLVKIDNVQNRLIKNLSKGYRQRVGFAQALIGNPDVLILDEPTVGLDPKQIIEIRNLIARLGKNHTIILSSHILSEIQAVCKRVIIINKGQIIADDTPENLSNKLSSDHSLIARIVAGEQEMIDALSTVKGVKSVTSLGRKEDGSFDYEGIKNAINKKTKMVTIQRSKGYQTRPTLSVTRIGELIAFIKNIKPDVICMVDNCYGEFVETIEPTNVGADLMVGSLIKNPGGGLAPAGGYIVGKKKYVENAAYRLLSPGLGKEVGATLGVNGSFYQGFFLAPTVTAAALKGAVFAANVYEKLGFAVVPNGTESRHDIIQAVTFGKPEGVIAFCQGIQAAAPVDSFVSPEPWDMPGYDSPVIMAAGAFVQGSSIELSADGPIKPPYAVYFQGGLTWQHAKFGILMSLQKLVDAGMVTL